MVVFNEDRARDAGVIGLPNPDPIEVLRKRLAAGLRIDRKPASGEEVAAWIALAGRRKLFEHRSAAEVVRFAEAACDAVRYWDGLGEDGQRQYWTDESAELSAEIESLALDRLHSWERELDRWNDDNQENPRLRVFQLAIAVLPSGDPIQIRKAANDFLVRVDGDAVLRQGLFGPGTRLLARDSLAQLSGGKVVFPRPGFDEAVVRYFWDDWPEFRSELLAWLMTLATDKHVDTENRTQVKKRIGLFAIRHAQLRGEFDFLYEVVKKWADGEGTFADAVILLEQAATAPGIASPVRDRTLQWAKQGNPALKRVVAELCASPTFAPAHPKLVVFRLGHLMTGQGEDPLLAEILERACRLLVTEGDQAGSVLKWLGDGFTAENAEQRVRAVRLFLPIARARAEGDDIPALVRQSVASDPLKTALAPIWGAVLRRLQVGEIQPAFDAWMDACATIEVEKHVIGIFKSAVASELDGAGSANQVGARLSLGWRYTSALPLERATEIDRHLLVALRDGEDEVRKQRFGPDEQDPA